MHVRYLWRSDEGTRYPETVVSVFREQPYAGHQTQVLFENGKGSYFLKTFVTFKTQHIFFSLYPFSRYRLLFWLAWDFPSPCLSIPRAGITCVHHPPYPVTQNQVRWKESFCARASCNEVRTGTLHAEWRNRNPLLGAGVVYAYILTVTETLDTGMPKGLNKSPSSGGTHL